MAGCAATATTSDDTSSTSSGSSSSGSSSSSSDTSASYTDGTYSASGSYTAPSGQEEIDVELTLVDDVVTEVTVTPTATDQQAAGFQEQFASGIAAEVVGQDIDSLNVTRVAGSSLTSTGFMAAVDAIKAEALES
ncbi:hypothetical protein FVQ89_04965 [Homoserinibacter sp. GY 40078]|nr:hypothetical protein FVQ89_04965 [Homoserinibacter sp. GY 40078]